MIDKRILRVRLRAERDAFVNGARPEPPRPPSGFIKRLRPGQVVAVYAPIGSETDPCAWADAARAAECTVALPHVVDRATALRFLQWPEGEALATGPFGLSNPQPEWPDVVPDVIVAPLLGFDAALHRLGQGAGHYDRAFAAYPAAWRVGLAWSVQQVANLPVDPWDVALHAIATECDWREA